jgi:hypothetical protein
MGGDGMISARKRALAISAGVVLLAVVGWAFLGGSQTSSADFLAWRAPLVESIQLLRGVGDAVLSLSNASGIDQAALDSAKSKLLTDVATAEAAFERLGRLRVTGSEESEALKSLRSPWGNPFSIYREAIQLLSLPPQGNTRALARLAEADSLLKGMLLAPLNVLEQHYGLDVTR